MGATCCGSRSSASCITLPSSEDGRPWANSSTAVTAHHQIMTFRVSTIIPCYNHGDLVARAVESVTGQSQTSGCEVIIVDDGSTDDTPAVCAELARKRAN